jgi:hypothetical protein
VACFIQVADVLIDKNVIQGIVVVELNPPLTAATRRPPGVLTSARCICRRTSLPSRRVTAFSSARE